MRAFAWTAFHENAPVVLLDDPIRQGEAEARALPDVLGGEERIVNARDVLRCNSHTGVAEVDNQRAIHGARVYRQSSPAGHRVAGVEYKIHENLLKLRCAAICRLEMCAIIAGNLEPGVAQLWLQQLKRVVKNAVEVKLTELSIASARKVQ